MLFAALSAASVLFALIAVTTPRILRAAVALIGVLVSSAGLFLVLGAEFMAGVQVLVYVGGVVVLLVFAIMLTRTDELSESVGWLRRIGGALGAAAFFGTGLTLFRGSDLAAIRLPAGPVASVADLGRRFVDSGGAGYLLPFELVSFCLLAVLIGGIVIAVKKGGERD
jgi:NADH-quinone oxidoreductase subunit J